MKANLYFAFNNSLDTITGSGWSIKKIGSMCANAHTTKPGRKGSSYIATPPKLAHPKSGLINIQNHDI